MRWALIRFPYTILVTLQAEDSDHPRVHCVAKLVMIPLSRHGELAPRSRYMQVPISLCQCHVIHDLSALTGWRMIEFWCAIYIYI